MDVYLMKEQQDCTIKCFQITLTSKKKETVSRFIIMQNAYLFGIKGFAKREGRSSLYIEAEGSESQLKSFLHSCEGGGSVWLKTKELQIKETSIKNYKTFEII